MQLGGQFSVGGNTLCHQHGLTEQDFRNHDRASDFGNVILLRQQIERQAGELACVGNGGNKVFVSKESVFISVLYSPSVSGERSFLVSTFPIVLPPPHSWTFSGKAVVGKDVDGTVVYEWYALSGSQFKFYPKLSSRLHGTELFTIPKPSVEMLRAKAARLFGD